MAEVVKIRGIELKVVGVTFSNDDGTNRQNIIKTMAKNSPIMMSREPQNKFDTNAIKVSTIDGQVGYIGKDYSSILAPMMDSGRVFEAQVKETGEWKSKWFLHIVINEV